MILKILILNLFLFLTFYLKIVSMFYLKIEPLEKQTLLEKFNLLASYPKTRSLNVKDNFINCTYKIRIEENNKFPDFSNCEKKIKNDFDVNDYITKEIIFEYMEDFEKRPKKYMIEQLDNIIFKDSNNIFCFSNGDRVSTEKSRSCMINLTTNRKKLFEKNKNL